MSTRLVVSNKDVQGADCSQPSLEDSLYYAGCIRQAELTPQVAGTLTTRVPPSHAWHMVLEVVQVLDKSLSPCMRLAIGVQLYNIAST